MSQNRVTENRAKSGGSQEGGGQRQQDRVRQVKITLLYDQAVQEITVGENQPVSILEGIIASGFRIPADKQVIYGWPAAEPRDNSVSIGDLKIPNNTLLYVATSEPLASGIELNVEGEIPPIAGSSRDAQIRPRESPGQQPGERSYAITVFNLSNGEDYDEIPFEGSQTVLAVKLTFENLSDIPLSRQLWEGWPDAANDDNTLADISLDQPIHTLTLTDLRAKGLHEVNNKSLPSPTSARRREVAVSANIDPAPEIPSSVIVAQEVEKEKSENEKPTPGDATGKLKIKKSPNGSALHSSDQSLSRSSHNALALTDTEIITNGVETQPQQASSTRSNFVSLNSESHCYNYNSQQGEKRKHSDVQSSQGSPSKTKRRENRNQESAFLKLPPKAIKKILQYIDPLTQLALRRVCKVTKSWTVREELTFAEEEKWKKFQLVISGNGYKTFETVIKMGLPITKYTFDVQDERFYEGEDIETFTSFFGLRVVDLTLQTFFMFQNPGELRLFESFHRIEKLTLQRLVVSDGQGCVQFPVTLSNLQVLKLNYEIETPLGNVLLKPRSWVMTWNLLSDCRSLLYFRFPRIVENERSNPMSDKDGVFAPLVEYIDMKKDMGYVDLDILDLKHFDNPQSFYLCRYVDILRKCYKRDIKLKNVQSVVVQHAFDDVGNFSDSNYKFCENVTSLINVCPFIENAPLRNLEKITVDITPSTTDYSTLGKSYKDIFWPNLKVIKIKDTVQQEKTTQLWNCWREIQEDLYGRNKSFDRGSVNCIKIDSPKAPYFLSEGYLAKMFYNVTRLEITSWFREDPESVLNKRLTSLWKRLRLQELRIENCPRLNDKSFLGLEEKENSQPAFLRLTPTLRKLTLGLDGVKKVTDTSLVRVFSRMELRTFIILSSRPVEHITEFGILKLLNREFGQHIEYFPFHCWSSSRISADRFKRLGMRFRSTR